MTSPVSVTSHGKTLFSACDRTDRALRRALRGQNGNKGTGQYSESTYASSGDQLAVVKLDTLKIVAGLQEMIQAGVRDERAVVQLQDG